MYANRDGFVESCCYDYDHVENVLEEIKGNFEKYFHRFLETNGGISPSDEEIDKLKKIFYAPSLGDSKRSDYKLNYKSLIVESYESFEKDRQKYLDIFDEEALEEYEDDTSEFKSKVLKIDCPIIHSTYFNKTAKELDKYRGQFSRSNPNELLRVVKNLCEFGNEYAEDFYDDETYENISDYEELGMQPIDTEEFTVYGVIGGGIKSHMLYKVHPSHFPNRSRSAIWALWYLTNKKDFGCYMDSEFIMIDVDKNTTQQNYFYPYELFSYYAFEIYKLLRDKAEELGTYIDADYRYVVVDKFLSFIADEHDEEIDFLTKQAREDGGMGYA